MFKKFIAFSLIAVIAATSVSTSSYAYSNGKTDSKSGKSGKR